MKNKYSLFSVYGIEIEYMIVDFKSLNPLPIADKVLQELNNGEITNEVELGDIAVSNELALHVIELKTNGPTKELLNLDQKFSKVVIKIQDILNNYNAIILPTGMHPWFTPDKTLKLWPHSNNEIYDLYHEIFNCEGHGWGNLQSTHINLPFANEEEFIKLHEAIRLLLPIIPALTSSTPFVSENNTNTANNRLLYYGKNQALLPCISGKIIPEAVNSYNDYHTKILNPMYEAISPYDPEKILQDEWLNSRGAIARFERNAIEIRIVDSQESQIMDTICVMLIVNALKYLIIPKLDSKELKIHDLDILVKIYQDCIKNGSKAVIADSEYLSIFALNNKHDNSLTAKDIWLNIFENIKNQIPVGYHNVIEAHLESGNLADRLIKSHSDGESLLNIYKNLHRCLIENKIYKNEQ